MVGPVAQRLEQRTHNPKVESSILSRPIAPHAFSIQSEKSNLGYLLEDGGNVRGYKCRVVPNTLGDPMSSRTA